jgi:hypothetical protein
MVAARAKISNSLLKQINVEGRAKSCISTEEGREGNRQPLRGLLSLGQATPTHTDEMATVRH